jgi:hypothetical protein
MDRNGTLVIRRETGLDVFRSMTVVVDNQKIGKVKENETIEFQIDPGEHEIHLKMILAKTLKIKFSIKPGEKLNFYCRGKYKTHFECLSVIFDLIFYPNEIYILDYIGSDPFPSKRYSLEITTWKKVFVILYTALLLAAGIFVYIKKNNCLLCFVGY